MGEENKEFIETQKNYSESVDSIFKLYDNQLITYTELKSLLEKSRELYNVSFKNNEKPITKRWRDDEDRVVKGFYVGSDSLVHKTEVFGQGWYLFATEKQAKSALAMAQISQIMANDERFGGVVTDEEWENVNIIKHIITRLESKHINETLCNISYTLLAFHTKEQRELFLEENRDLVKDYLMID